MQQHLITVEEVSTLARELSIHLEEEKVETYIREAESIDIKSALGDALFLDIKEHSEKYELLLEGGMYDNSRAQKKLLTGLKTALAYYTYARIVKSGDMNVTRFGTVLNDTEESTRPSFKEKLQAYNDAFSIAARYMQECVDYIIDAKLPLYDRDGKVRANGTTFKIIGI